MRKTAWVYVDMGFAYNEVACCMRDVMYRLDPTSDQMEATVWYLSDRLRSRLKYQRGFRPAFRG